MSKSKSALTVKPVGPVDWTGVRVQRVEHDDGDSDQQFAPERGVARLTRANHPRPAAFTSSGLPARKRSSSKHAGAKSRNFRSMGSDLPSVLGMFRG